MKKIKNEKELEEILNGIVQVPVYYSQNVDSSRVEIDCESMREEFEKQLQELVYAVVNY